MLFWTKEYSKLTKMIPGSAQQHSIKMCGIDPGIRNFMSLYDSFGNIKNFTFGQKDKISAKKFHYKVAKHLTKKYDVIYYGDIIIYHPILRFDLFKKTLLKVASKNKKCKVIVVDESFTTKTCSCCGHFMSGLTVEKEYTCEGCGELIQRDSNAAKNIMLKGIIGSPSK